MITQQVNLNYNEEAYNQVNVVWLDLYRVQVHMSARLYVECFFIISMTIKFRDLFNVRVFSWKKKLKFWKICDELVWYLRVKGIQQL